MAAGSTCPPAPTPAPWKRPKSGWKGSCGPSARGWAAAAPGVGRKRSLLAVRLTVIGCSGSFPGPDSPASCYLLQADGFRLLADLGSGALGALQRHAGLFGIDAVCLSHLHADHCLDLCGYWVARTYAPGGARPPIPVYGPEGTARRMAGVYGRAEHPGMADRFRFETLRPGTLQLGPFQITLA